MWSLKNVSLFFQHFFSKINVYQSMPLWKTSLNEMKNMIPAIRPSRILQASLLLKNEDTAVALNPREQKKTILANEAPQPNIQTSIFSYCSDTMPMSKTVSKYTCGFKNVKIINLFRVCRTDNVSGLNSWMCSSSELNAFLACNNPYQLSQAAAKIKIHCWNE